MAEAVWRMNNAVGAGVINDETVERRILDQLAKAPPQGFARWHDKARAGQQAKAKPSLRKRPVSQHTSPPSLS
jgi:hypothetical protein